MVRDRTPRFVNPAVVLVDPDAEGRYGPWLDSLLVTLVDEGLNPVLVSPGETALGREIPEGAKSVLNCPRTQWDLLRQWGSRTLVDRLANEPVRLVLAASGRLARYAAWLANQLAVPLAVMVMGEDEIIPAAAAAPGVGLFFAGSKSLAARLKPYLRPEQADRVVESPLGVHVGPRAAAFQSANRVRGILGAGPLELGNNFEELIAAFAQLNDRDYEAVYFIAGSGPAEHELRRLATARGLAERLTFVPDIRQFDEIYAGIDVFVQPFVCRRLDLRLLDAMAWGLATLVRAGGAVDIISDEANGIELAHGNEAELTMLLTRLLDEPEIGRKLGAGARQFVQANHLAGVTVARVAEKIRELVFSRKTLTVVGAGR